MLIFFTYSTDESKDEPYAWEAREFLRRKLIGQDVTFATEKSVNTGRSYGTVWLGKGICTVACIHVHTYTHRNTQSKLRLKKYKKKKKIKY